MYTYEVTCIHTSGLRKIAVVALGHTAIGESERPIEQDRVSGENETALRDLGLGVREDRYPLDNVQVTEQLNSFKGSIDQWSYSARPIFMDRFFPCT